MARQAVRFDPLPWLAENSPVRAPLEAILTTLGSDSVKNLRSARSARDAIAGLLAEKREGR